MMHACAHAVVIKLVYESANVYTISSSVLPENELAVMGEIERIPKPIYDTRFATVSQSQPHMHAYTHTI